VVPNEVFESVRASAGSSYKIIFSCPAAGSLARVVRRMRAAMHKKHSHFSSGLDKRFLKADWKQTGLRVMKHTLSL
jgi:hypothetical protein